MKFFKVTNSPRGFKININFVIDQDLITQNLYKVLCKYQTKSYVTK